MVSPSDPATAEAADDCRAFDALFREAYPQLVRYCRKVDGLVAAEDIAQETMLRAFVHLPTLDVSKPLWPWLKTIALNLVTDERRRRRRDARVSRPGPHTTDGELERAEDRLLLAGFLSDLTASQRAAIRLRYLEERDHREAASLLALSGPAFKQLLYRARLRLRLEYERVGDMTGVLAPLCWLRRLTGAAHDKLQRAVVQASRVDVAGQVTAALLGLMLVVGGRAGLTPDDVAPADDTPVVSAPATLAVSSHEASDPPRDRSPSPAVTPSGAPPPAAASSDRGGQSGSGSVDAPNPRASGDKAVSPDPYHSVSMTTRDPDPPPPATKIIDLDGPAVVDLESIGG